LTLETAGSGRKQIAEGTEGDSEAFWLPLSGRSAELVGCDTCAAFWDVGDDGGLTLFRWADDPFNVAKKYATLTKQQWASVGLRLSPDAGNLACSKCDAEFRLVSGQVTPLHAARDPYEFVADYKGQQLSIESIRYLGVYKTSGKPGPVCSECRTEFDSEGDYLRLRGTSHDWLVAHVGEARPMEDWHRLARGLPAIDEEAEWQRQFDLELRHALLSGEIAWADRKRPEVLWRSEVDLIEPRARGRITLSANRLEFESRKHRLSAPVDAVRSCTAEDDLVTIRVVGEPEPLAFRFESETVAVELESGRRDLVLEAIDFAQALRALASDLS